MYRVLLNDISNKRLTVFLSNDVLDMVTWFII